MPVVHIVLVKVKEAVLSNGFDELKAKCETLKDLPIAKSKATEIKWGPPAYPGRNEGYNWGEYMQVIRACCMRPVPCPVIAAAHPRRFPPKRTGRVADLLTFPRRSSSERAGLYSVFASREDYEAYRDDEEHRK